MLPEYFNGPDEMCQFCVHRDRIVDCQKKFAQRTLVTEGWRWTCVARHKAYIEEMLATVEPNYVKGEFKDIRVTHAFRPDDPVEHFDDIKSLCGPCQYAMMGGCSKGLNVVGDGQGLICVYREEKAKQSKIDCLWTDLDPTVMLQLAQVSKEGYDKYGPDNWRKISQTDHINHALTHVFMHLKGDTTEAHLLHAICRLIFAVGVDPCGEK